MPGRAYIVGKTRFRVNTKESTRRFGHLGTLVGMERWTNGRQTITLEFEERGKFHREKFRLQDVQRVYMTTPPEETED